MYKIKKEYKGLGAKIILTQRFMGKSEILLDEANQVELEYLYNEIKHPFIIKTKIKEEAE